MPSGNSHALDPTSTSSQATALSLWQSVLHEEMGQERNTNQGKADGIGSLGEGRESGERDIPSLKN